MVSLEKNKKQYQQTQYEIFRPALTTQYWIELFDHLFLLINTEFREIPNVTTGKKLINVAFRIWMVTNEYNGKACTYGRVKIRYALLAQTEKRCSCLTVAVQ